MTGTRLLVLAFGLLLALPLYAADTQQRLQEVEEALRAKKAAAEQAALALDSSAADAGRIQAELQQAMRDETAQQEAFDKLTEDMAALQTRSSAARAALKAMARRETAALGMMLRLSRLPVAVWWLYDGISLAQERRMLLLRGAAQGLERQAEAMRRSLAEAERLQALLVAKQEELLAAKAKLQERADRLNRIIAERQTLAVQHREEFASLKQEMTRLSSAASDLRALLDKMAREQPKPSKQDKAARGKEPAMVEGSLLPVSGSILRGFGTRDDYGITSRGLTLAARPRARVVAPLAGKAVFVGPFKGYGTIIILQHEGGLHSLLAGFAKVDLELGQQVQAGEPIGLAGTGKNGKAPEIYFELRRKGDPINPLAGRKRQS